MPHFLKFMHVFRNILHVFNVVENDTTIKILIFILKIRKKNLLAILKKAFNAFL